MSADDVKPGESPYDANGLLKDKRKKPGPPPKCNWAVVKAQYETGMFSVNSLSRSHGVSDRMIRKKINEEGWAVGNSALMIARRTREEAALMGDQADRAVAVDSAVRANVEIIRDHQTAIGKGRALTMRLLDELNAELEALPELHELVEKVTLDMEPKEAMRVRGDLYRRLTLGAHTGELKDLAAAAKTWIELERQAFNMDADKGHDDPERWTDERLNARLAHLLRKAGAAAAAGSEGDEEPEA